MIDNLSMLLMATKQQLNVELENEIKFHTISIGK